MMWDIAGIPHKMEAAALLIASPASPAEDTCMAKVLCTPLAEVHCANLGSPPDVILVDHSTHELVCSVLAAQRTGVAYLTVRRLVSGLWIPAWRLHWQAVLPSSCRSA